MLMEYNHLFQPLDIGRVHFKNRIFSAPVQTGYLDGNGYYTDYAIHAFSEKARGGCSLVSLGDTPVDSRYAVATYRHPVIDDPGTLPSLSELVRSVHEYGSVLSVELNHAGDMANPAYNSSSQPIGPVDYVRKDGQPVRQMNQELMDYTLESFAQAAALAKLAGVDIINIQAGHGWLLHQFLSPRTNTRRDNYGGSIRNRCRFPLEVLARVRETVGPDTLIQLSVSAAEYIKGGTTLDDTLEFIRLAREYVDLIYVTASVNTDSRASTIIHSTTYQPHTHLASYAAAVKQATDLPVVAVGGILSPEEGEEILAAGQADAVAMGRALIADPYLPYKAKHGDTKTIRPCLRCLNCLNEMSRSRSFSCTVNPISGREFRIPLGTAEAARKMDIVIIGGGPAGMVAATAASQFGHQVTLFEKEQELGGMLKRTLSPSFRSDMARYLEYLKYTVQSDPGIRLQLGTTASPELLYPLHPDAVILATGSLSRERQIPGWDRPQVHEVSTLSLLPEEEGSHVIVVGGGVSGCEAALHLAEEGRKVTVLESGSAPMPAYSRLPRIALLDRLNQMKVEVRTECNVNEITEDGVRYVSRTMKNHTLASDFVVLANGRDPDPGTAARYLGIAPTVVTIGAAKNAGSLLDCVHDGYFAGRNIEFY